jgi:hypothetical protein
MENYEENHCYDVRVIERRPEAPEKWPLNFRNDEISKFKSTWHRPRY